MTTDSPGFGVRTNSYTFDEMKRLTLHVRYEGSAAIGLATFLELEEQKYDYRTVLEFWFPFAQLAHEKGNAWLDEHFQSPEMRQAAPSP